MYMSDIQVKMSSRHLDIMSLEFGQRSGWCYKYGSFHTVCNQLEKIRKGPSTKHEAHQCLSQGDEEEPTKEKEQSER